MMTTSGADPMPPLASTAHPEGEASLLAPGGPAAFAAGITARSTMPRLAVPRRGAVETDEHHQRPQGCRVAEGEGGQIKVGLFV